MDNLIYLCHHKNVYIYIEINPINFWENYSVLEFEFLKKKVWKIIEVNIPFMPNQNMS